MTLLNTPHVAPPIARRTPARWSKAEYNEAVERGSLRKRRVYLYRGELIEMPAMGTLHARGISRVGSWVHRTFEPEFVIRGQSPFALPDESMPQREFVVVTGEQEAPVPHPNAAVLVIGIADRSVELDQEMAFDYAAALVPDYWLVNVRDQQTEVYRDSVADPASPTGHRYASRRVYAVGESLAPLARPDAVVTVAALAVVA